MKTNSNTNFNYRYPGSRPFYDTDADRLLFFGRKDESKLLLHQVLTSNLIVLYAKSGLGKTSLINAGLKEALREEGLIPFMVRFNNPKIAPLEAVYDGIIDIARLECLEYEPGEEKSLWQFFKTAVFKGTKDRLLKPVLILDQFEELFTFHSMEKRKKFTRNLAESLYNIVPTKLAESIREGESSSYSDEPTNVKIIISIREDFIGQLEEMSEYIPSILRHRFRLMPLDHKKAREAIKKPSQVKDKKINSPVFKFTPDAVSRMLRYLSKQRGQRFVKKSVESFQLQLICRHMEEKAMERLAKGEREVVIGKNDLGGEAGMRLVLEQFYDDQVNRLPTKERENVRKLCEKGLISVGDWRLSLQELEIKRIYNISKKLLKKLEDMRLLRSEPRLGNIFYELSHDTLVAPIRSSQLRRSLKRTSIEELYEEARELHISMNSEKAAKKYQDILRIDNMHINTYLELGQIYYEQKKYGKAVKNYSEAIDNGVKNALIYFWLGRALFAARKPNKAVENYLESLKLNTQLYMAYEGMGDVYRYQKKFRKAIENYEEALKMDIKKTELYIKLAKVFIDKKEPHRAIDVYQQAIKVDPDFADIYYDIAEALKQAGESDLVKKVYEIASTSGLKKALHYFSLGYDYAELEEYERAIKNYRKAVEIDPKYTDAYSNLGDIYYKLVKYEDAIDAYNKTIEINPDDETAYNNMGNAYYQLKKYTDAIGAFDKAIEIDPEEAAFLNNKGNVLFKLGKYKEAVKVYKEAINIDNENIVPRINLAKLCLISNCYKRADLQVNEVLKVENISSQEMLAIRFISISSHLFQGKQPQAEAQLKEVINCYKSVPGDYQNEWDYSDLKSFISRNKKLPYKQTHRLLQLIDILESPTAEGLRQIKELEDSRE